MKKSLIFVCNQYGPGSGALKRIKYLQQHHHEVRTLAIATKGHSKSQNFQNSVKFTQAMIPDVVWSPRFSLSQIFHLLLNEMNSSDRCTIFAQHQSGFIITILLRFYLMLFRKNNASTTLSIVEVGSFKEKSWIYKFTSLIAYYLVDNVICISETTLETLPKYYGMRAQYLVIYNGFDLEAWMSLPTEENLFEDKYKDKISVDTKKFCMITRDHPVKRNEEVFEYFCESECAGLSLFVAGAFDEEKKRYWSEKSDGRIIFLGFLNLADIKQVIEFSDVYISFSRSEGMSEALLQAAALSKQLILSEIPSFIEFSRNACKSNNNIIFLKNINDLKSSELNVISNVNYTLGWCNTETMAKAYLTVEKTK